MRMRLSTAGRCLLVCGLVLGALAVLYDRFTYDPLSVIESPNVKGYVTKMADAWHRPLTLEEYLEHERHGARLYDAQAPMPLGCRDLLSRIKMRGGNLIGKGTVKDVYMGEWRDASGDLVPAAILRLKKPVYNGDFSSGIGRLLALRGHPQVVPIMAACPHWPHYVEYNSKEYNATIAELERQGVGPSVVNTIVAPLARLSDLSHLSDALAESRAPQGWRGRLRLAIDYARLMSFLWNEGPEKNPFGRALVQKDFKLSQFLLYEEDDGYLTLKLNDAEAMPDTDDEHELRMDALNMKTVVLHIFDSDPPYRRPAHLDTWLASYEPTTPSELLNKLLSFVHIDA